MLTNCLISKSTVSLAYLVETKSGLSDWLSLQPINNSPIKITPYAFIKLSIKTLIFYKHFVKPALFNPITKGLTKSL